MPALHAKVDINRRLTTWHLLPDAGEHENSRALLRSEGHIAFVNKADRTSGIERVGIENLLILVATRAAGRFTARPRNDPDRPSADAGRTSRTGRASGARRTSGTGRPSFALGWRLVLPARDQEKGG